MSSEMQPRHSQWLTSSCVLVACACLIILTGCRLNDSQILSTDSSGEFADQATVKSAGPTHQFSEHSMTLIPAGSFEMGSAVATVPLQYRQAEMPPHTVSIQQPFWMCQTETTVGQFRRFVEDTGYVTEAEQNAAGSNRLDLNTGKVVLDPDTNWREPGFPQTEEHPVVCVSHADALAYCDWLSRKHGKRFRLPTEEEWEFACRGGTQTVFSTGNRPETLQKYANTNDHSLRQSFARASGTAPWDDGHAFTAPVASFGRNEFGMFDMHGNVGEWCNDWFAEDAYSNPMAQSHGPRKWRVVRGGSWYNTALSCRSSGRHDGIETATSQTNGFRIVMDDSSPE